MSSFSYMVMGLRLAALRAARASLLTEKIFSRDFRSSKLSSIRALNLFVSVGSVKFGITVHTVWLGLLTHTY